MVILALYFIPNGTFIVNLSIISSTPRFTQKVVCPGRTMQRPDGTVHEWDILLFLTPSKQPYESFVHMKATGEIAKKLADYAKKK